MGYSKSKVHGHTLYNLTWHARRGQPVGSNWVASRAVASYYVWRQSPCKNLGVLYEKSIITILKGKTHSVLTSHTLPSLTKHWLWAFDFFHPGTTTNIIKSRPNTSFRCVIFYVVQWAIFNCKWDSFNGDISPTFPTLSTVAVSSLYLTSFYTLL